MIHWDNLLYLVYGILGTGALLLVQWLVSQLLPRLPYEVLNSMQRVEQTNIDGDYQGDSDIYNLDQALMEAELNRPGSTFRIYYHHPAAIFARLLGSVLLSFTITGWVIGIYAVKCMSLITFFLGICLLLYPLLTWNSSKPRLMN